MIALVPTSSGLPKPVKISAGERKVYKATDLKAEPIDLLTPEERKELENELKVDLNTASVEELLLIPRVGPSMASAIVKYREEHGPFNSYDEVDEIPRVGKSMLEVFKKYTKLGGADPSKVKKKSDVVDINTATEEDLQRLPRVGPAMAKAIVEYREKHGPFTSVEDLTKVPRIGSKLLETIREKIVVSGGKTGTTVASLQSEAGLDLNKATAEELTKIPGIGPSTAEAIVKYREEHGDFKSIEELDNVPRIGPSKIEKIRPYLRVSATTVLTGRGEAVARREEGRGATKTQPGSSAPGAPVNINTASAADLEKIKGIGPSTAKAIVKYREENGPFSSLEELDNVPRIGPSKIEKIRPYVTVE